MLCCRVLCQSIMSTNWNIDFDTIPVAYNGQKVVYFFRKVVVIMKRAMVIIMMILTIYLGVAYQPHVDIPSQTNGLYEINGFDIVKLYGNKANYEGETLREHFGIPIENIVIYGMGKVIAKTGIGNILPQ